MSKWETAKLGELTKIRTGKLDVNAGSPDGIYPFFTCSREPARIASYSYDCECVLVAGNGDLNVKYYNGKFDAYQRTYIIESMDKTKLFVPYLYYFLTKYVEILRLQSIGGVIKYIKLGNLTEATIPLPPLETQKKISEILDTASELLDMRGKQLAELDTFIKAVFYDMFGNPATNEKGWEVGKIKDLVIKTQYGTSAKASTERLKYPILRMNNITYQGEMDFTDLKYIDLADKDLDKYLVHQGEVLFNRTNSKELVGKTAVYREKEPMAYAGYLIRLIPNEKANGEFISAFLNSPYGKKLLRNMAKNIVGMANINAQELENTDIYIPPITLQNKFAEIVKKTEEQKQLVRKAIDETQYLFDSLMSEYFD